MYNKIMIVNAFKELNRWIQQQNTLSVQDSSRLIHSCEFKLLGQSALLEASLSISLAATGDVDAYTNAEYPVCKQLDRFLEGYGMHLDPFSHEVWMPEETTYSLLFKGQYLDLYVADPEYVLLSKALKAPERNMDTIVQYLANEPTELFFDLCEQYGVDLEEFLKDEER